MDKKNGSSKKISKNEKLVFFMLVNHAKEFLKSVCSEALISQLFAKLWAIISEFCQDFSKQDCKSLQS